MNIQVQYVQFSFDPLWFMTGSKLLTIIINDSNITLSDLPITIDNESDATNPKTIQNAILQAFLWYTSKYVQLSIQNTRVFIDDENSTKFCYVLKQKSMLIYTPNNGGKTEELPMRVVTNDTEFILSQKSTDSQILDVVVDEFQLSGILVFSRLVTDRSPLYVAHLRVKSIKSNIYAKGVFDALSRETLSEPEEYTSIFDRPKALFRGLPREVKAEINSISVSYHMVEMETKRVNVGTQKVLLQLDSVSERELNFEGRISSFEVELEKSTSKSIQVANFDVTSKFDWTKHKKKLQVGPDITTLLSIKNSNIFVSDKLMIAVVKQMQQFDVFITRKSIKQVPRRLKSVPLIDKIHLFGSIEVSDSSVTLEYQNESLIEFLLGGLQFTLKQSLDEKVRYSSDVLLTNFALTFVHKQIESYSKNFEIEKALISTEFDGKDLIEDISVFLTISTFTCGFNSVHADSCEKSVKMIQFIQNDVLTYFTNTKINYIPKLLLKVDIQRLHLYLKDSKSFLILKSSLDCLWNLPSWSLTVIFEKTYIHFVREVNTQTIVSLGKFLVRLDGETHVKECKASCDSIDVDSNSHLLILMNDIYQNVKSVKCLSDLSSKQTVPSVNHTEIALDFNQISLHHKFTTNTSLQARMKRITAADFSEKVKFKGISVVINDEQMMTFDTISLQKTYQDFSASFQKLHFGEDSIQDRSHFHLIDIKKPSVLFAHNTNLGFAFDEIQKSIKAVQTKISPLDQHIPPPVSLPRLIVQVSDMRIDFQDSPVEKCLTMHMQLWPQEYFQRHQREVLLFEKLKYLNLTQKEIEKMNYELQLESEDVYLNRIKYFLQKNIKSRELFTIEASSITIDLRQGTGMQTRQGVLDLISKIDPTPVPKDESGNSKLHMLVPMTINMDAKAITLSMRNFPLPFMKLDEFVAQGNVILGSFKPERCNSILTNVSLSPEVTSQVEMTILPLYKYYQGNINIGNMEFNVGTSFDPAFQDIGVLSSRLSPMELDPSKPNNWWDTMRRTCHGSYQVGVRNCRLRLLWGVNCYDQTDYIDCQIGYFYGIGSRGSYKMSLYDMMVRQNPNLSSFTNNIQFPYVDISLDFMYKCKGDPFDHYFEVKLPQIYQDGLVDIPNVNYDTYSNWRSSELNCIFKATIDSDPHLSSVSPTIMYDPLSTSWFMKFVKFMENEPLEIFLGKTYKYMLPHRKQYDVLDYLRSFQLCIISRDTHIVWSNGVEDNNILHAQLGHLKFYAYLYREKLPEITQNKRKREKREMKPIAINASVNDINVMVHSYNTDEKPSFQVPFGKDFFVSVKEVLFVQNVAGIKMENVMQGNDTQVVKEIKPGYENQLLVTDLRCLWNPALRDAVMIWVDVAQQYMFDELEILQRLTLKKIEETSKDPLKSSPRVENIEEIISQDNEILQHLLSNEIKEKVELVQKKQHVENFFVVLLKQAQVVLVAEETEECMVFSADNGQVEVRNIKEETASNIITSKEILCLMENMKGFVAKTETNIDETWTSFRGKRKSQRTQQVMEEGAWVITVNIFDQPQPGKPIKTLNVDVPQMTLNFSSSHLQTLIDVITNSMIPKKMIRTVTLEDQFSTILYKSKLNPESWGNVGNVMQKCEETRKEIRRLESLLNSLQREASKGLTDKLIEMMNEVEDNLNDQKAYYHGMKETLNKNVNSVLSKRQDERVMDMVVNIIVHSLTYNMMDKHGRVFAEILFTLFRGSIVKNLDYSILHDFTLHHISAKNRLPNPIYEDMLMPYNEHESLTEESDYMLRICANKKPPIGGIGGMDHLEIDLSPIHLQITYELYRALWNYCFPLSKQEKHEEGVLQSEISTSATTQIKKSESQQLERRGSSGVISTLSSWKSKTKDDVMNTQESDIDEMKQRAKSTKIFNYVRMQEVQLFVSLMGVPESEDSFSKYVRNFEKLSIHINPITYNQQIWTWQDFFENLKKDVVNQALQYVLPETVKSFTKNRLTGVLEMITKPLMGSGSTAPTLQKKDSENRLIKGAKKITQEMVNLKEKIKGGSDVEESKLKQIMLFGKNQHQEDVGKKIFGSNYEPIKKTDTPLVTSDQEIEVLPKDIFDLIKKEHNKDESQ